MNSKKEDSSDLLDRGFLGKPDCMIIVLLAIIAFFVIKKIATKYLDNYLYWFRWLDLGKNVALGSKCLFQRAKSQTALRLNS